MKRPNKKDYDFNDLFESNRYAINITKYVNYLEKQLSIHGVVKSLKDEEVPTFDEFLENFTKGTGSKKQPIYYYRNVWRPERYMYDYYCDKYNL